jgi:hypothetical protein
MVLETITGMLTGAIEGSTGMFVQIMELNTALAIGFLFVLILMAYKMFKIALRAVVTGILAAFIPVAAVFFGIDIGISISLNNMIWFAIFGISAYLVYASVNMGLKTVKLVTKPFGFLFKSKPKKKIIIKEIKEEND